MASSLHLWKFMQTLCAMSRARELTFISCQQGVPESLFSFGGSISAIGRHLYLDLQPHGLPTLTISSRACCAPISHDEGENLCVDLTFSVSGPSYHLHAPY